MRLNRRDFLRVSAMGLCTLVVSTGVSGCSSVWNPTNVSFLHGIASGDPREDSVIIWTRLTPDEQLDTLRLIFEVSKTEDFNSIVRSGIVTTKKEQDYTLKIDLQELEEGTVYYYRFKSNEKISIVGKTKTISSNPSQVKMAVFSCSNYTNGYFNAYMEASKIEDLDVAIHLGDYIYEYGMFEEDDGITPAYATSNAAAIGRVLPSNNDTELLTLDDYRKRYALYHTDEGSIALHKSVPLITVWDDHEVTNDTYKDGAQNHDASEGDFEERKTAALQAYFEWLPIRPFEEDNNEIIYRSFEFGNLVSLYMLDTRVLARDEQLSYSNPNYYDNLGNFNATAFQSDLLNPSRSMLGTEQLNWLQGKFSSSSATWQVLGQQVLMGKMFLPAELLLAIGSLESATDEQKPAIIAELNTKITELITIKTRILSGDTSVTALESARISTVVPYNLDAWDGYFVERETILGTAKALKQKFSGFSRRYS